MLTFEEFTDRARRCFDGIPEEFRRYVEGPIVEREAKEHDVVPGHYILGECVHHPDFGGFDFGGESPLFSSVILYYGSFRAIARRDADFDVGAEIDETVLHEVRHHLEDAAGIPTLRDLDWAEDQNELRRDGAPHADRYWRGGLALSKDGTLWRVGSDLFVEVTLRRGAWRGARREGLSLRVGAANIQLRPEEIPAEVSTRTSTSRVVLDWDWDDAPELAAIDDGHAGHDAHAGHLAPGAWGQLVVVLMSRGAR